MLAGGRSERFGSPKTLAEIDGEPLLGRPVSVLLEVLGHAAVVCKEDTPLPELAGAAEIWHDADVRSHPAAGIVAALDRAGGPVAVLGGDMPWATAELVGHLVETGSGRHAVAIAGGVIQPLAACYLPSARAAFAAAIERGSSLRAVVESLDPVLVEADTRAVASVNVPEDLR